MLAYNYDENKQYVLKNTDSSFSKKFNEGMFGTSQIKDRFDGIQIEHVWGKTICDFPKFWGASLSLLISRKAKEVLQPLIDDCVEFISTDCLHEELYLIHTLKYLDAVDHDTSLIRKLPSGLEVEYLTYQFIREQLGDTNMFRVLLNNRPYTTDIFVTSKLKKAIEDNELTGIDFIEVWDSEKNDRPMIM